MGISIFKTLKYVVTYKHTWSNESVISFHEDAAQGEIQKWKSHGCHTDSITNYPGIKKQANKQKILMCLVVVNKDL